MVFSATIGAVLALVVIASPADRPGSSILQNFLDEYFPNSQAAASLLDPGSIQPASFKETQTKASFPRFIVRFDEGVPAKTAMRSFRENRSLGRKQFDAWVAEDERFNGFRLEGLTPSGEAVISYVVAGAEKADPDLLRRLTRQLTDAPDVIYADPFQFIGMTH